MPQLETGVTAPAFEHPDHDGKRVTLDGLRLGPRGSGASAGSYQARLVLYFFPKADTAG